MAENTNNTGGGGNTGIAFIVGGLLVVVAIIAWFVFARGGVEAPTKNVDVDVNLPSVDAPAAPKGS